jgi:hypothetical protein
MAVRRTVIDYVSLMGWMEFVSKLVGSLAWPGVASLAAWRFRQPVKALLEGRRLSELKAGPGGIEMKTTPFDTALEEAAAGIDASVSSNVSTNLSQDEPIVIADSTTERPRESLDQFEDFVSTGASHTDNDDEVRLYEMSAVAPLGAVIASFQQIEVALAELAERFGYTDERRVSASANLRRLADAGAIDEPTADAIKQLTNLRNLAVHNDSDLSPRKANEFIRLSTTVLAALESQSARNYELAIALALRRISGVHDTGRIESTERDPGVDMTAQRQDRTAVAISTKFLRAGRRISSGELRRLATLNANPVLLVSNADVSAADMSGLIPSVRTVLWRSPNDDPALGAALEAQFLVSADRNRDPS